MGVGISSRYAAKTPFSPIGCEAKSGFVLLACAVQAVARRPKRGKAFHGGRTKHGIVKTAVPCRRGSGGRCRRRSRVGGVCARKQRRLGRTQGAFGCRDVPWFRRRADRFRLAQSAGLRVPAEHHGFRHAVLAVEAWRHRAQPPYGEVGCRVCLLPRGGSRRNCTTTT